VTSYLKSEGTSPSLQGFANTSNIMIRCQEKNESKTTR